MDVPYLIHLNHSTAVSHSSAAAWRISSHNASRPRDSAMARPIASASSRTSNSIRSLPSACV